MTGHFVSIGGCTIFAMVSRASAVAPWLVFSNSLMTDHTIWEAQARHFAGYNILRYDQRGHGRSEVTQTVTFDQLSGDVLGLLDHFEIETCVYIGLSMGVPTGLNFARRNPHRLSRMVLSDGQMVTMPTGRQTWQSRIEAARANGMAWVADDTIARWFSPDFVAGGNVEKLRALASGQDVAGYCACATALQDYDFTSAAAGLGVPVLLLAGSNDGAMPQSMDVMAKTIANAQFALVEGAGHIPNFERPDEFNALVDAFLNTH